MNDPALQSKLDPQLFDKTGKGGRGGIAKTLVESASTAAAWPSTLQEVIAIIMMRLPSCRGAMQPFLPLLPPFFRSSVPAGNSKCFRYPAAPPFAGFSQHKVGQVLPAL